METTSQDLMLLFNLLLKILTPLVGGIIAIYFVVREGRKSKRLFSTGVQVEGIIFELDGSSGSGWRSRDTLPTPIVRFVTKEGEWITGVPTYYVNTSFTNAGDTVQVLYDPHDPSLFSMNMTEKSANGLLILFILIGSAAIGYGIYQLAQYLQH